MSNVFPPTAVTVGPTGVIRRRILVRHLCATFSLMRETPEVCPPAPVSTSAITSSVPSATLIVAVTGWDVSLLVGPWTVWTVADPFPTVPSRFPVHGDLGGIYQNSSCSLLPTAKTLNRMSFSAPTLCLTLAFPATMCFQIFYPFCQGGIFPVWNSFI